MEYPANVIPNPRPFLYVKKRKPDYVYKQIINIVNKMYPHTALHILDIACGDGSLALQIREFRVEKQLADEIITVDRLEPPEPLFFPYYQIDLNNKEQFEQLAGEYRDYFDIILGIDTIEYLENPKMYLSYLKEMLHEDGHLFISASNINNPVTRRTFYKKGKIERFCENGTCKNIILPHMLESLASSLQLNLMIEYALGLYPKFWLYPDRKSIYVTLCNILMPRFRGSWCKLYIFSKEHQVER